jgi:hypothetical protein
MISPECTGLATRRAGRAPPRHARESFIRECPEQYFWTHRKFKDRPGEADAYRERAS